MWSHDLKCPTDIHRPEPVGICDRCSARRYLKDLIWQYDWRGNALQNLRIRVCRDQCADVPQPQLRPIIVGPDPIPPRDPRPPLYQQQMRGGTSMVANTPQDGFSQYILTDEQLLEAFSVPPQGAQITTDGNAPLTTDPGQPIRGT